MKVCSLGPDFFIMHRSLLRSPYTTFAKYYLEVLNSWRNVFPITFQDTPAFTKYNDISFNTKRCINGIIQGSHVSRSLLTVRQRIFIFAELYKIWEELLMRRLKPYLSISPQQFGFAAGKSLTNGTFIARQLQEKFLQKKAETIPYLCGPVKISW